MITLWYISNNNPEPFLKNFITYFKDFIKTDFSLKTYGTVFIFISAFILLNYSIDLENELIDKQNNSLLRYSYYLLLYSTAYYGTLAIYYFTTKVNYFLKKELLIKSFIALALISFDSSFILSTDVLTTNVSFTIIEATFLKKIIHQLFPILLYIIGFLVVYYTFDFQSKKFYGLSKHNFYWKPYLILFLCIFPLIVSASFQEAFTNQYPFYKYWNVETVFGLTQKQQFIIYEFFYLFNFINIELLFRGLLILGMVKFMGQKAVLPMIVTYAFLHFGKPPLETISSVFGGYILGIIAFRTETIVGGILIHIGIAFLMDLCAILQRHNAFF